MKFEWDEEKNKTNIKKHGVDFSDAWQLFEHPLLVWPDERLEYGEDRFIGLGMLNNMMVVFVAFVERQANIIRHFHEKGEKA